MKRIDPFTYNLPILDLHGEYSNTILFLVKDFINDNIKLKNKKILVIHGKGEGILKKELHTILKSNENVSKYYLDPNNLGETIIELK